MDRYSNDRAMLLKMQNLLYLYHPTIVRWYLQIAVIPKNMEVFLNYQLKFRSSCFMTFLLVHRICQQSRIFQQGIF